MAAAMSDVDLRSRLAQYGTTVGPITDTTRQLYLTKLKKLEATGPAAASTASSEPKRGRGRPPASAKKSTSPAKRGRKSAKDKDSSRLESDIEDHANRSGADIIPGLANMPSLRRTNTPAALVSDNSMDESRNSLRRSPIKPRTPHAQLKAVAKTSTNLFEYSDNDDLDLEEEEEDSPEMVNASVNTSFVSPATQAKRRGIMSSFLSSGGSETRSSAGGRSKPDLLSSQHSYTFETSNYGVEIDSSTPRSPYARRSYQSNASPLQSRVAVSPFQRPPAVDPTARFAQANNKMGFCGQIVAAIDSVKRGISGTFGGLFGRSDKRQPSEVPTIYPSSSRYRRNNKAASPVRDVHSPVSGSLLVGFAVLLAALALAYVLVAYRPSLAIAYRVTSAAVADTGSFLYTRMILPALLLLTILATVFGVYYYQQHVAARRAKRRQQLFAMIENITEILREHLNTAAGRRDPYLPIPHVRDMLIKPAQRLLAVNGTPELLSLWSHAQTYINENESRVITESKFVSGQESLVWRWVQQPAGRGDDTDNEDANEHAWMGSALSSEQQGLNSPTKPVTECLKIRGLFDVNSRHAVDWVQALQDALLEKIGADLRVKHLAVDTQSAQGCVYAYLFTREEAFEAYKRLHGFWFDRRLVSVKFLRLARYLERFPDAAHAAYPLQVQKPRHSLWSNSPEHN